MIVYLDASVLVALFTEDVFSSRADVYLRQGTQSLIVSDFAGAEFASAVSRKVRAGELTIGEAKDALSDFDAWNAGVSMRPAVQSLDIEAATAFLRRLDLPLRAPDAIHIAIARRLDAELATFDRRMAADANTLGVTVPAV